MAFTRRLRYDHFPAAGFILQELAGSGAAPITIAAESGVPGGMIGATANANGATLVFGSSRRLRRKRVVGHASEDQDMLAKRPLLKWLAGMAALSLGALVTTPAAIAQSPDTNRVKAEAEAYVTAHAKLVQQIVDSTFSFQEIAYNETQTGIYLTGILQRHGFTIRRNIEGSPTAWVVSWSVQLLNARIEHLSLVRQSFDHVSRCPDELFVSVQFVRQRESQ